MKHEYATDLILTFHPIWCRLTQVVLEKRPLNGCSSSSSGSIYSQPSNPSSTKLFHETRKGIL